MQTDIQMEDKKCRICGLADMANASIHYLNSKLIEKIVAVFPIIMYPNDPLPKHICRKCLFNTTTMYVEIEKAIRNQNKWIANVRAVQPDNHYVKVVDSIEGANKQTSLIVSKVAGEELGPRTVCHLFNLKPDETHSCNNVKTDVKVAASVINRTTSAPDPMEVNVDTVTAPANAEKLSVPKKNTDESVRALLNNSPAKMTQIKSVLELNGCTLSKVKPTPNAPNEVVEIIDIPSIKVEIKEEPPFEEQTTPEYSIECKMCLFRCETVEELAIHQLDHLTLSLPKLCERKYLDKRTRRGRLIRIDEKKCIRCLNCWRIFMDNKSILHHWSTGDCDYFCIICGKEFASSPKMLREHIPAAHGVSYKSLKLLRPPTLMLKKIIKKNIVHGVSKPEPPPAKSAKGTVSSEALSVKVACNICLKVFANFKARNSHMRAHKHPPPLPVKPPPSLSDTLLAFNRSNLMPVKEEVQDIAEIPYQIVRPQDVSTPSTSRLIMASNPLQKQQLNSSLKLNQHRPQTNPEGRTSSPAGIRTKYVQIRPNHQNSIIFKKDPGNGATVLKVKSLVDLQDPSVSSQQPEDSDKSGLRAMISAAPVASSLPAINGLSVPALPKDNMNYGQIFNCHPCGGKFSSKLELFRHKRKCTANNLFPCQFCSRHFLTSADLQMHIMLLHKSSAAQ